MVLQENDIWSIVNVLVQYLQKNGRLQRKTNKSIEMDKSKYMLTKFTQRFHFCRFGQIFLLTISQLPKSHF